MPINKTRRYYFIKTNDVWLFDVFFPFGRLYFFLNIIFALFISTIQKQPKQTNKISVIYYKILFIFVVFVRFFLSVAFYSDVGNFCRVILWWVKVLFFFISVNRREQ